jgi:FKBP-type peptidyl-prolyl cis-trans isomerase
MICACCGQDKVAQTPPPMQQVNQQLIGVNRELVSKEATRIDGYLKRNQLEAEKTGTGLRIIRKKTHPDKAMPKPGDFVTVHYTVKLLDGTLCYSTKDKKPEMFKVGMDQVESGLHEGIQLMHVGDEATLILPPHLAHGLIGDQEKIPPLSSIVYDIELVSIR